MLIKPLCSPFVRMIARDDNIPDNDDDDVSKSLSTRVCLIPDTRQLEPRAPNVAHSGTFSIKKKKKS